MVWRNGDLCWCRVVPPTHSAMVPSEVTPTTAPAISSTSRRCGAPKPEGHRRPRRRTGKNNHCPWYRRHSGRFSQMETTPREETKPEPRIVLCRGLDGNACANAIYCHKNGLCFRHYNTNYARQRAALKRKVGIARKPWSHHEQSVAGINASTTARNKPKPNAKKSHERVPSLPQKDQHASGRPEQQGYVAVKNTQWRARRLCSSVPSSVFRSAVTSLVLVKHPWPKH